MRGIRSLIRYVLFTPIWFMLLAPAAVLAAVQVFSFVPGSTKTLSCTDASGSTTVALPTAGPQLYIYNRGTVPCFVDWGDSTVTAGTGDFVAGPGPALVTRNVSTDLYVACRCATSESATVYVGSGYGE